MEKLNAFFVIGTVGMLITSSLHIFMAALIPEAAVHATYSVLYPVFVAFLVIGTVIMSKKKRDLQG